MVLGIERLSKQFDGQTVLSDVSFHLHAGESFVLTGASGEGKTTLLKIIAGLTTPDSGEVRFAENTGKHHPAVMVFQDYQLFPHMTARQNIMFGPLARGVSRSDALREADALMEQFGISHKKDAYPLHLSGGERQRVAIARSLIVRPLLLLLDEPFANLDRSLKRETVTFLRQVQKDFGQTILTVTHDIDEGFALADRIGIMLDGTLRQCGTPEELYNSPTAMDIARFFGELSETGEGKFARPEWIYATASTDGSWLVESTLFQSGRQLVTLRCGSRTITATGETLVSGMKADILVKKELFF